MPISSNRAGLGSWDVYIAPIDQASGSEMGPPTNIQTANTAGFEPMTSARKSLTVIARSPKHLPMSRVWDRLAETVVLMMAGGITMLVALSTGG